MSRIIINEEKEVKRILKHGFSRSYINLYELGLLAKYYHEQGLRRKKIKAKLVEFCTKQDNNFNEVIHADVLNRAVESTKRFSLRNKVGRVGVTASEINAIRHLPHKYYKVLFFMLVLAKVEKFNKSRVVPRPEQLGYFVNQDFYSILKACGLRVTRKDADEIKYLLDGQLHLISASLLSSRKWKVLFADDKSPAVVVVEDAENIFQYMPYYCTECGQWLKKKSKQHDLCETCYKERRKSYIKERVRRHRQNKM